LWRIRTIDAASWAARGRLELDDVIHTRLATDGSLLAAERGAQDRIGPQKNSLALIVEVGARVDELEFREEKLVLLEVPERAARFQSGRVHYLPTRGPVANGVQRVDHHPQGSAIFSVVRGDLVAQLIIMVEHPPTTPESALKTRHYTARPSEAEVTGDILEPIRERRKMHMSMDLCKDVRGPFAEARCDLGPVPRVALHHTAEEGRLVASIVEEDEVPEACRDVEKPPPDNFLFVAVLRPERLLGRLSVCDGEHADEVIRRRVGIAFDIEEERGPRGSPRVAVQEVQGHESHAPLSRVLGAPIRGGAAFGDGWGETCGRTA
jgi:hypothetical protein